jgi:adenylate cyclase
LLRGLKRFWCYTRESCAEAQHHFAQAAILDPEYAAAHAWLARTYHWQACMNWIPNSKSTMDLAVKHARRAVELDDQSSLAHAILGWVELFLGDIENTISEGRRACEVDPNSADAKLFLSLILASTGHGSEALRHIETAMLLHPHPSSFYFEALGLCYFALADYDRAIAAFWRGIEINPLFVPCHSELAITYGVCGRAEAAQAAASIVKADWPNVSLEIFLHPPLAAIYHRGKQVAGLV